MINIAMKSFRQPKTTTNTMTMALLSVANVLKPKWRRGLTLALSILLVLAINIFLSAPAQAQNAQNSQGTADQSLRSNSRVDPSTLGMSIQIPLRAYPGRAGMNLPVTLYYSSKVWRIENVGVRYNQGAGEGVPLYTALLAARYAEFSSAGWTSSLGVPLIEWPKEGDTNNPAKSEVYDYDGKQVCLECHNPVWSPSNYWVVDRLFLHLPDGSTHELRKSDTPHHWPVNKTGKYYAVDGSRLIYDADTRVLYLPDGSHYEEIDSTVSGIIKLIDRNGNTLSYNASNGVWTDTLGRSIGAPPMGVAGDQQYYLPGSSTPYVLRWTTLQNALTNPGQSLQYNGDTSSTDGTPLSPSLWGAPFDDSSVIQTPPQTFNPVVLKEVELPNGSKYKFSYNIYGEIDRIELPTGGAEDFEYGAVDPLDYNTSSLTNRGVHQHWIRPTLTNSNEQPWTYSTSKVLSSDMRYYVMTTKETAPDGTYSVRYLFNGPPEFDRRTGERVARFGYNDVRNGGAYDEQSFNASGQMLRRKLTNSTLSYTQFSVPPPNPNSPTYTVTATRDPKVTKEVEITFEPEANPAPTQALWTAKTYSYDQASQPLNVTSTTQYGFATIDLTTAQQGAITSFIPSSSLAIATAKTSYIEDQAYIARNMTTMPSTLTTAKGMGGASDPVVAQMIMQYDETALDTYSAVSSWSDPQTSARGNVTTVKKLRDVDTNSFVTTKTKYDQCGSAKEITDANNNVSKIDFTDSFLDQSPSTPTYAYPTSTTTPKPDDTGAHGSSVAFGTSTSYYFNSGLASSTTDANGKTTSFEYDSLNRPKKVTRPTGGGSTSYEYGDTSGNIYVHTQTTQTATQTLEAYQYFDGLGRPQFSFKGEGRTWIGVETKYDALMGRVEKSSNPYRTTALKTSASSPEWTTNIYDALGRVKTVTTPDGAQVGTEYNLSTSGILATVVTVSDQAQKKRRSFTDGVGRLIQVTEPDNTNSLDSANAPVTTYDYDVLGNLVKVTQHDQASGATQIRNFNYNALSQLKSAQNPESGTITYDYDDNGNLKSKTDARLVTTTYAYDALNRVTTRSYSNDPQQTPQVDYYYDGVGKPSQVSSVPNAKGRLTAVKSTVSETYYINYDGMGRIKEHWQNTSGATEPYVMKYDYDLAGNLIWQQYPSGRIVQTDYDQAGRVAGVKNGASVYYAGAAPTDADNRIQYTPHGAVEKMKLGNGLWEHTLFNNRLQPTEIGLGTSGIDSGTLKLSYTYGVLVNNQLDQTKNNGNVQSQTISAPCQTCTNSRLVLTDSYTYDELNRLKNFQETGGANQTWNQVFLYDRFGNRNIDTTQTTNDSNFVGENPTIDLNNNRIAANQSYSYDPTGNLTDAPGGRNYVYDGENRQTSYKENSVEKGSYAYDGDGRRVKKIAGGVTTIFVYNALGQLVAEYGGVPVNNGTHYLTSDMLGSTRVVTDSAGSVKERHDYLPFGGEIGSNGTDVSGRSSVGQLDYKIGDTKQKFAGYEMDTETGLNFAKNRNYSNLQGRFTSSDPIYFQKKMLSDPQRFNLYVYVRNNPLTFVDPDGMMLRLSALGSPSIAMSWLSDLAGDLSGALSYEPIKDSSGNIIYYNVSFNTTSATIGNNEGARLINDLVSSTNTFLIQAGGAVTVRRKITGKPESVSADKDGFTNITNRRKEGTYEITGDYGELYRGVDSIVLISTNIIFRSAFTGEDVLPIRGFIHEASEAFLLAQGVSYQSAHGFYQELQRNRRPHIIEYPAADSRNAITRECIISDQLNLKGGPAGWSRIEGITDLVRK